MTDTELKLTAAYRGPIVRLADICKPYLNLGYAEARRQAAMERLPFAAFRLNDSTKSPLMVRVADLARHIDDRAEEAAKVWKNSQV